MNGTRRNRRSCAKRPRSRGRQAREEEQRRLTGRGRRSNARRIFEGNRAAVRGQWADATAHPRVSQSTDTDTPDESLRYNAGQRGVLLRVAAFGSQLIVRSIDRSIDRISNRSTCANSSLWGEELVTGCRREPERRFHEFVGLHGPTGLSGWTRPVRRKATALGTLAFRRRPILLATVGTRSCFSSWSMRTPATQRNSIIERSMALGTTAVAGPWEDSCSLGGQSGCRVVSQGRVDRAR
jgi:hypothetical protein